MNHVLRTLACGAALLALVACESAEDSQNSPSPPVDELEFLHERIVQFDAAERGGAWLVLGPHSRSFHIDPEQSPDAEMLVTLARDAHTSGDTIYATVWNSDPLPKSPENLARGKAWTVLRLAATPDPRGE